MEYSVGVLIALAFAAWGYYKRFLTLAGAICAAMVGASVWLGGGLGLALPLIFFFVASSAITKWSADKRYQTKQPRVARRARQVLANGAVASVCALITFATGETRWLYGSLCALATMTGDTWSSEIGQVYAPRPFDLRTWRRAPAGISGAISWIGTFAGLLGAVCTTIIGIVLLPEPDIGHWAAFGLITGWAVFGGMVDSILGATVQMRFKCPSCNAYCDKPYHCGTQAKQIAGIPGIGNNAVNFLTTVFAGLLVIFF